MAEGLELEAGEFVADALWDAHTEKLEAELNSEGGYRPWTASELFWRRLPKQRSEDLRRAEDDCYRTVNAGRFLGIMGWAMVLLFVLGCVLWFAVSSPKPHTSMQFYWNSVSESTPAVRPVVVSVYERRLQA